MNSSSISEVICMCSRVEGEQGGWDMYLPDPELLDSAVLLVVAFNMFIISG
jgi:hypothetical protein